MKRSGRFWDPIGTNFKKNYKGIYRKNRERQKTILKNKAGALEEILVINDYGLVDFC